MNKIDKPQQQRAGMIIGMAIALSLTTAGCAPVSVPDLTRVTHSEAGSALPNRKVIKAIAKRLIAGIEVAAYKTENDLPIFDPAREAEVIDRVAKEAASRGVDKTYALDVITDQMEANKLVQRRFVSMWNRDSGALMDNPSLEHARSVISDATVDIVDDMSPLGDCSMSSQDREFIRTELRASGLSESTSLAATEVALGSLCQDH